MFKEKYKPDTLSTKHYNYYSKEKNANMLETKISKTNCIKNPLANEPSTTWFLYINIE